MKIFNQQFRTILSIVLVLFMLGGQAAIPAGAFACGSSTGSAVDEVKNGVDQSGTGTQCSGDGVTNAISAAVSILSYVIGAAAIIMIIISGFRYITSGGDSSRVSGAKSALIYALVGIVIAALAQFLVHFVLYQSNNAINPSAPTTQTPTVTKQHAQQASN